jgi:hypothetical protein
VTHAPVLAQHHVIAMVCEIRDRGFASKRQIDAIEAAGTDARKRQGGFAQGLARDRAGVDARTTDLRLPLDQERTRAHESGGYRAANAGGAGPNHHYIEGFHGRRHRCIEGVASIIRGRVRACCVQSDETRYIRARWRIRH